MDGLPWAAVKGAHYNIAEPGKDSGLHGGERGEEDRVGLLPGEKNNYTRYTAGT